MHKGLLMVLLSAMLILSVPACSAGSNKIAVITLNGPIQSEANYSLFGGASISPALVRSQLERAKNDFMVKAAVIQINSPGGDVSACEEIRYEMDGFNKPLVVSMRTIAASGGYYISAGADKIVALPTTNTGSIGVITYIPSLIKLFDKIGIDMQVIKSGKYKDMYSGFKILSAEEIQIVQQNADQAYDLFIDVVAKGRNLNKERVKQLATGQLYSGVEAKELGLVDEIGGLQTAIDLAAKQAKIQQPVIDYYREDSGDLLKLLLGVKTNISGINIPSDISAGEGLIMLDILGNTYPRYLYR